MWDLTKYKDILGKPGEGVHFHVGGWAIMDFVGTILLGWLLGWLLGKWLKVNSTWLTIGAILAVFVLGQFLHWIFGVDTTFMKLLK